MNSPSDTIKASCIVAIVLLTSLAIFRGIDGWILALGLSLLGGIGGYSIGRMTRR